MSPLPGKQGPPQGAGVGRHQPEALRQRHAHTDRPDAEAEAAVGQGGGGLAAAVAVLRLRARGQGHVSNAGVERDRGGVWWFRLN